MARIRDREAHVHAGTVSLTGVSQENQRSKSLERPVVAFCNIENEIYAEVNEQVIGPVAEDLSEDEEDQNKDVNPVNLVRMENSILTTILISSHHSSKACFLTGSQHQTRRTLQPPQLLP